MQAAATTSRFLTGRSSKVGFVDSENIVRNDHLLRDIVAAHLIQTVSSQDLFLKLTDALIQLAEQAYLRRNLDTLEDVSQILMNLPVDGARQIGLYYHALVVKREGQLDEAQMLLETVADRAPLNYRARATQSLGANYLQKGQLKETLRFQLEALRMASSKNGHGLQTMLMAHGEIAVVRSLDGDHKRALSDLEGLWPLVCHVARQNPFYFYLFKNELAVELGEAGRIEEAEAASKIALASQFASAYPEWAETRHEIEAKRTSASTSVVAVSQAFEVTEVPHTQPQACLLKPQPFLIRKRIVAFCWLSSRGAFQRFAVAIVRSATFSNQPANRIILEQLGRCLGPRAPPACA